MIGSSGLEHFDNPYAHEAAEANELYASYQAIMDGNMAENYSRGFAPLESLPAKWYNSMFYVLSKQADAIKVLADSLCTELFNVLKAADPQATFDPNSVTQLITALQTLITNATPHATTSVFGTVKLSALDWGVQNNANNALKVNTVDASTSAKGIVQLSDSVTSASSSQAATSKAVKAAYDHVDSTVNALDVTDTAVAGQYVSKVSQTDGKISVTRASFPEGKVASGVVAATQGMVTPSDATNSNVSTTVATSKAVKAAYDHVDSTVNALDVTDTAVAGQYVSKVSQTDGKISVTRASFPALGASGANHKAGLAPDPGATAGTTKFLREDATWASFPALGASGANHKAGLAPDPGATAGTTKFLREDATWAEPPSSPQLYLYAHTSITQDKVWLQLSTSPTPPNETWVRTDIDGFTIYNATIAHYLGPKTLVPSTLVTADINRNLKAHTLELE